MDAGACHWPHLFFFAFSLAPKHQAASQQAQSTYQANAGIWIVFFFSKTHGRHEIKPMTTMTCDLPSTLIWKFQCEIFNVVTPSKYCSTNSTRRGVELSLQHQKGWARSLKWSVLGVSSNAAFSPEAPLWRPPPMPFAAVKETGAKLPNMWAYCRGISRLMILRCHTWLTKYTLYYLFLISRSLTWGSFKDWIFVT